MKLWLLPAGFNVYRLHHWLAVAGGLGLMRRAPGTWGTVAGLPLALLLLALPSLVAWPLLLLAAGAGVWICGATARDWGTHDHGAIVWDEVVGYALTVLLAACWLTIDPLQLLLAFVLFRLFDILKPWPISYLDRHIHGGLGIMLDDLLAGIFAGLVMIVMAIFI